MIDQYKEIVELIQKYSEDNGLSYLEGFEKAKKELLSERAGTQISDSSLSKKSIKLYH